jgi:hypothetical protein
VNRRDNISIILAEYMSEVLDVEIQAEWVVSIKDCDSYEDNYIAVKYVRGTHPYRSEGIKIRREALQEWMDKRTTGGSMAGFPVRRGFTQQNPKENEVNRLFTEARSTVLRTPVPPKTWATARAAYTADEVNRLQVSCRQALKTGALEINGVTCTALTCSCMYSGEALCPHRQFAYLFGWDRSYVLEQPDITLPGVAGHVAVPIALGQVMLPVEAVWEVAEGSSAGVMAPPTGWVRISGNPLTTLCREFSAFPEESAVVRLGPEEGVLKVTRYIEDMIRSTEAYQRLMVASEAEGPELLGSFCRRTHSNAMVAKAIAGLKYDVATREAFILANAYQLAVIGLCNPCRQMSSGSVAAPDF